MQRFLTREELLAEYTTPDDDPSDIRVLTTVNLDRTEGGVILDEDGEIIGTLQ